MTNKNKIINQAQKFIQKGQWDKAIKELQKLVAEDPNDVRTLLKLGDVYAKKGERDQATKVYKQVAESYSEQGFFLKAVAVYKQILKHDPKHLEVTLKLAELYEHLGLASEAMGQYQVASQIHEEGGQTKEALEVLRRMVDLDVENVASRIKLAEGYSRENRTQEAIEEFHRAADTLKRQNRTEDYIKVAERLVYHDPDRIEVIKELAKLYLGKNDTKRALAKLQLCFKAQPQDVETLSMLATAFKDLGQPQKTVFVYRELARIHREAGRADAAHEILQQILQIEPNDPEASAALGLDVSADPSREGTALASPTPNSMASMMWMTPAGAYAMAPPGSYPSTPPGAYARGQSGAFPLTPPGPYVTGQFSAPSAAPQPPAAPAPRAPALAPQPMSPAAIPMAPSLTPRPRSSSASQPIAPASREPELAESSGAFETPRYDEALDLDGEALAPAHDLMDEPAPFEHHASAPSSPPVQISSSEPRTDSVMISKILTETDVYVKYGLREKALDHLRKIFEVDPDNVLAYAKMRDIYLGVGDASRAAEAIANLIYIHSRNGDTDAMGAMRNELERIAPGHPLIAGIPVTGVDWPALRGGSEVDSFEITENSDVYTLEEVAEDTSGRHPAVHEDSLDAWFQGGAGSDDVPAEDVAENIPPEPGDDSSRVPDETSVPVREGDILDSTSLPPAPLPRAARGEAPRSIGFDDAFEEERTESSPIAVRSQYVAERSRLRTFDEGEPGSGEAAVRVDDRLQAAQDEEPAEDGADEIGIDEDVVVDELQSPAATRDLPGNAIDDDLPEASISSVVALDELEASSSEAQSIAQDDGTGESDLEGVTGDVKAIIAGLELPDAPAARTEGGGAAETSGEVEPSGAEDRDVSASARDDALGGTDEDLVAEDAIEDASREAIGAAPEEADARDTLEQRAEIQEDDVGIEAVSREEDGLDEVDEHEVIARESRPAPRVEPPGGDTSDVHDAPFGAEETIDADQLEDELDEAEFLADQGLSDEAHEIVENVLRKSPAHPRALSMRQLFARAESKAPPPPAAHGSTPRTVPSPPRSGSETFSDDELLSALEGVGDVTDDQSPEDHYDLGMAYKEVGRFDDAIAHFKIAVRASTRAIDSLEMIAHCLLGKNDPAGAIRYFWNALERGAQGSAATNLKFEIAQAYEIGGDIEQAITWFRACHDEDPGHRNVAKRLEALGASPSAPDAREDASAQPGNGTYSGRKDAPKSDAKGAKKNKISYL